MNETSLLLKAYYELLYEHLEALKDCLTARIEQLLVEEIAERWFGNFNKEKHAVYRDACPAFVDERIETYNPIGIQYTFDAGRTHRAFELELQLNWYDARVEFEALREIAAAKVEAGMTEEKCNGWLMS